MLTPFIMLFMAIVTKRALSFDDVLIIPEASDVLPDSVSLGTRLTPTIALKMPIISAAMDTVTKSDMAISVALYGGIGVLHRSLSIEEQANEVSIVKAAAFEGGVFTDATTDASGRLMVAGAVGTGEDGIKRTKRLLDAGVDCIVVDTAHGHNSGVIAAVEQVAKIKGKAGLIAGNVVTESAVRALFDAGAEGVKVGIGPGSICTTRIVAGVGVPQLTAIMQIAEFTHKHNMTLVADGGIRSSGDIAKAIAAGADCVMLGNMLAGTTQAPGSTIKINGIEYKVYRGMGSVAAMKCGSASRYFQKSSTCCNKFIPEGVEGLVRYRGDVEHVIYQLLGGLRAAMGYTGNTTIAEMQKNCRFVEISTAGLHESNVHSLHITQE